MSEGNLKRTSIVLLLRLGFKLIEDREDGALMDSPGTFDYGMPVVQAYIYPNQSGTYSVDLDGGFKAPIVENMELFVDHLNTNFPGWNNS